MNSQPLANRPGDIYAADRFAPPAVLRTDRANGDILLRSPLELTQNYKTLGAMLEHWAAKRPNEAFLAERDVSNAWRKLSYAEALRQVRTVAAALLDMGLTADTPIMTISDNSIEHALLLLAGMYAGIPVAPISTAYARISQDYEKLRYLAELLKPGLVYIDNPGKYPKAIKGVDFQGARFVFGTDAETFGGQSFAQLLAPRDVAKAVQASAAVGPDTVAKVLFTSGSTGMPKGVINTQRMMCSNQDMAAQIWPCVAGKSPAFLDWLPWNHTFGGNFISNCVLRNGGTLYIDGGKPAPGLIEKTVEGLREVSPTIYCNVPRGFALILDYLEADEALCKTFFAQLEIIFYAGASLPQSSWERLERLSLRYRGFVVPIFGCWGLTETAPLATSVHFPVDRAGIIGLPAPGVEIKLVPSNGKLELRVRGPNVTPGYFRRPELQDVFDEEGFYRTGDAALFANPDKPEEGLVFDGRIAENFKLSSGTWVNVGELRIQAITTAAPLIDDLVITGHDRDEVCALVFPNIGACQKLKPGVAVAADLVMTAEVRSAIAQAISRHNANGRGSSSTRIARVMLMAEPPSIDGSEITDKGYINQRAVLTRRSALVEELYASDREQSVIIIE